MTTISYTRRLLIGAAIVTIAINAPAQTAPKSPINISLDIVALAKLLGSWVEKAINGAEAERSERAKVALPRLIALLSELAARKQELAYRFSQEGTPIHLPLTYENRQRMSGELYRINGILGDIAGTIKDIDPIWAAQNVDLSVLTHTLIAHKESIMFDLGSEIERNDASKLSIIFATEAKAMKNLAMRLSKKLPKKIQ